jgi:tRNA A-37 threonylcarbamoyl transferase component Bud32
LISLTSIARIEASNVWRNQRVEVFDLPEGRMLVKGQRPLRSPWAHRFLNLFAWIAGVPYAKAVPVHGGARSQAIEIARLGALHAAGVAVPQVHHVAPQYFVMTYLGDNDLARALRVQGPKAYGLWMAAMEHLLLVHARGQYLSQCFARNIIVSDRFEGLIDFEDDPLEVMTLEQAQARDWLIYLQSTLFNLALEPERLDAALNEVLERESVPVRAVLRHAAGRLSWLRHLPTNRRIWGKDFVSLQAVGAAMYRHHLPDGQSPLTEKNDA